MNLATCQVKYNYEKGLYWKFIRTTKKFLDTSCLEKNSHWTATNYTSD